MRAVKSARRRRPLGRSSARRRKVDGGRVEREQDGRPTCASLPRSRGFARSRRTDRGHPSRRPFARRTATRPLARAAGGDRTAHAPRPAARTRCSTLTRLRAPISSTRARRRGRSPNCASLKTRSRRFWSASSAPPARARASPSSLARQCRDARRRCRAHERSPFVSRIVVAKIDAAGVSGDPEAAIASAAFAALERDHEGVNYAAFADEAAHAGVDPLRAAAIAAERHDQIVQRLEGERAARDEVEAKRARLTEALLYETPGSRVDRYIRANRGAIEARLRRFDLAEGDPTLNYRHLVRDFEAAGPAARASVGVRAIWSYRGQSGWLMTRRYRLPAGLRDQSGARARRRRGSADARLVSRSARRLARRARWLASRPPGGADPRRRLRAGGQSLARLRLHCDAVSRLDPARPRPARAPA